MNTYIFSIPLDCGSYVRAQVHAPSSGAAREHLQQGYYELLDIHNRLVFDDAEIVRAYDFEGEEVQV